MQRISRQRTCDDPRDEVLSAFAGKARGGGLGKTRSDFWAVAFLGNYVVAMDFQGCLRMAIDYWG